MTGDVWEVRTLPDGVALELHGGDDPALLVYLDRLRLEQAERDRHIWRVLDHLARYTLPAGGGEVVIYSDSER